jgi:hypothetical protein
MLTEPQAALLIWMVETGESSFMFELMYGPIQSITAGPELEINFDAPARLTARLRCPGEVNLEVLPIKGADPRGRRPVFGAARPRARCSS